MAKNPQDMINNLLKNLDSQTLKKGLGELEKALKTSDTASISKKLEGIDKDQVMKAMEKISAQDVKNMINNVDGAKASKDLADLTHEEIKNKINKL